MVSSDQLTRNNLIAVEFQNCPLLLTSN